MSDPNFLAALAAMIGNTIGQFIKFTCPYCRVKSNIAQYGGNIVQGGIICPNCKKDISGPNK